MKSTSKEAVVLGHHVSTLMQGMVLGDWYQKDGRLNRLYFILHTPVYFS